MPNGQLVSISFLKVQKRKTVGPMLFFPSDDRCYVGLWRYRGSQPPSSLPAASDSAGRGVPAGPLGAGPDGQPAGKWEESGPPHATQGSGEADPAGYGRAGCEQLLSVPLGSGASEPLRLAARCLSALKAFSGWDETHPRYLAPPPSPKVR